MTALGCDPAGTLTFVNALNATAATAGGSGDNTAANGAGIDLAGLPARFNGAAFAIRANATLAQGKKLTVTAKIQDSANGTTWADLVAAATVLTLVGGTGGTTEAGVGVIGGDLRTARRYVRVVVTPDLDATATDTASVDAVCVLSGADELPAAA